MIYIKINIHYLFGMVKKWDLTLQFLIKSFQRIGTIKVNIIYIIWYPDYIKFNLAQLMISIDDIKLFLLHKILSNFI